MPVKVGNHLTTILPIIIKSLSSCDSGENEFTYLGNKFSTHYKNTTFGGIQGFSKKPQTPFTDDSGKFAGIVHQERGWVYALFDNAGHEVPEFAPEAVRAQIIAYNKCSDVLMRRTTRLSRFSGTSSSVIAR